MKKTALLLSILLLSFVGYSQKNIYGFTVKTLDEQDFHFSTLKGKKIMIVNTASKCGLTPQYETLEKVYKQYQNQNFIIIGFPANNFLNQEPGNAEEILEFCTKNYGVTFPMMAKVSVKGEDIAEIYKWLTQKSLNGVLETSVTWNFQKYLINEKGELIGKIAPKEKPDSPRIIKWIETGIFSVNE